MLNHIDREQAYKLAVRYAAYTRAVENSDKNGIVVWSTMLLESQRATGIEVVTPELLNRLIAVSKEELTCQ